MDKVRIICEKTTPAQILIMEEYRKTRVLLPNGQPIYFPWAVAEINANEDIYLDITCDREFAEANVPREYICEA